VHARLPLPVLLSIEIGFRCHICDLCSKFEEDWTKTVVTIVDDRYCRMRRATHTQTETDRQTDRQTDSSDFISVQCHPFHWTNRV